jgi:hypothetical protein
MGRRPAIPDRTFLSMKALGRFLMALGATVGVAVTLAIFWLVGVAGAPWLVTVAFAKLGLVASLGLMAGGAASVRIARRREQPAIPESAS